MTGDPVIGPVIGEDGRATRDLFIPTHPGEDHIGVSVPLGEVVPAHLYAAAAALDDDRPRRSRKGA